MDHFSPFERWRVVIAARVEGKKQTSIAREHRCSQSTVARILEHFDTHHTVETEHRSGRPSSLSPDQLQILRTIIRHKRKSTSKYLAELLYQQTNVTVSPRSIRNYRRSLSFTPRKERYKLAVTAEQLEERRQYCIDHQSDDVKRWLFEDETTVWIQKTAGVIWVEIGEEIPATVIADVDAHVRIWGVVGWSKKIFPVVTGPEDHQVYIQWLTTNLAPHTHRMRDYKFIHDRCPWHKPKKVKEWFDDHELEMILGPVRAPQLNAIEYAWGWMKHHISEEHPTDQASLDAAVRKSFIDIEQKIIQHDMQHVQHLMESEASE